MYSNRNKTGFLSLHFYIDIYLYTHPEGKIGLPPALPLPSIRYKNIEKEKEKKRVSFLFGEREKKKEEKVEKEKKEEKEKREEQEEEKVEGLVLEIDREMNRFDRFQVSDLKAQISELRLGEPRAGHGGTGASGTPATALKKICKNPFG